MQYSTHTCLIVNLDSHISSRIKNLLSARIIKQEIENNRLSLLDAKQIKIAAENNAFIEEYFSAFIEYLQLKNALKDIDSCQKFTLETSKLTSAPIDDLNTKLDKWWQEIELLTSKWSDNWREYKNRYKSEIMEKLRKQGIEIEAKLNEVDNMTRDDLIQILKKAKEDVR